MSILETPRILFRGEMSWDPIVTNNYDNYYDEATADTIFAATTDRVAAFRQAAILDVAKGNWNPDGTHRASFFDTGISGVDTGQGARTDDPFCRSAVNFTGMLVDAEPYGATSSQLFFDAMTLGIDGGYRIFLPRRSRFAARYVNFGRNSFNRKIAGIASVVWQTSFHKDDGLRVDAFDSPALQALSAALGDGDVQGLTVRFNTYRTIYYDDPALRNGDAASAVAAAALVAKLEQGGWQPNPARSLVVGAVGLWRVGEPMQQPGDRALVPVAGAPVATAFARVDPATDTLAIDLGNSISEIDGALNKQDLGTIAVTASDPLAPAAVWLGTIAYAQYDRDAYERTSGIVTLSLPAGLAGQLGRMDITLSSGATGLFAEQPLRAMPAVPNLYLDQGGAATLTFQLYERGVPVRRAAPMTLYRTDAATGNVLAHADVTATAGGIVSLSAASGSGGVFGYIVTPRGMPSPQPPPNGMLDVQTYTYMYVRVLPADAAIAALPTTWENVYDKVLSNWKAMAPCMDNWLDLADPGQLKRYAPVLRKLTDPARLEDFRYMPVTRDLTPGKRTLLYRYLDGDIAWADAPAPEVAARGSATGAAAPSFADPVVAPAAAPDFSRNMPG